MTTYPIDDGNDITGQPSGAGSWTEDQLVAYARIESDLNAEILLLTMTMRKEFPELSKYIEEMPVTVPDMKDPMVTINGLQDYLQSLTAMLTKIRLGNQG